MVHTSGKIWEKRGLINSKGKELAHEELIRQVLESLLLPEEIAAVHVKGNQKGNSLVEWGNRVSDNKATEAALRSEMKMKLFVVPEVKPPSGKQIFKKEEIAAFKELEAKESGGQWTLHDGREIMNKQIMREILTIPHQRSHCEVQAMYDAVLKKYICVQLYTTAKKIRKICITCQQINKKVYRNNLRVDKNQDFNISRASK